MVGLAKELAPRRAGTPAAPKGLSQEEARLYAQALSEIGYVDHPLFHCRQCADRLFGRDGRADRVAAVDWPANLASPPLRGPAEFGHLSPEEQATLFLRYNYAKCRLRRLLSRCGPRCSLAQARQIILWHQRARQSRTALAVGNMGLVLFMAKRSPVAGLEFGDLASDGYVSLLRSIDCFDVSRGTRFSTYVCRAIIKSFYRLAARAGRQRRPLPSQLTADARPPDATSVRHEEQWEDAVCTIRDILSRNLASLTAVEQEVLSRRFALSTGGKGLSLAAIGREVGFSNERIRQILRGSLRKLRTSLDRQYLSA